MMRPPTAGAPGGGRYQKADWGLVQSRAGHMHHERSRGSRRTPAAFGRGKRGRGGGAGGGRGGAGGGGAPGRAQSTPRRGGGGGGGEPPPPRAGGGGD